MSKQEISDHAKSALSQRVGMELIESSPECTVIRMPVEGNTQMAGILHGGASAALCETAGSICAHLHAQDMDQDLTAVGTDLMVSHLRAVTDGHITATARAEHLGRRTTVHRVEVRDDEGRLIATCIARNMIIPKR